MSHPERMVSSALRAQAGAQGVGPGSRRPPPPPKPFPTGWVLMIALLVGCLVGVSLALVSLFAPGVLPTWGIG
jgi:hypothetical protein